MIHNSTSNNYYDEYVMFYGTSTGRVLQPTMFYTAQTLKNNGIVFIKK